MRRFLDWTAAQTASGGAQMSMPPNNPKQVLDPKQQGQVSLQQYQVTSQQHHQSTSSTSSSTSITNPARDLEIQHLTKLLHEIKYYQASSSPLPSAAGSQTQREFIDKVHKTLPLFLNVFGVNLVVQSNTNGSQAFFTLAGDSILTSSSSLLDDASHSESSPSSKPSSPQPHSPQLNKFPDLLPFAFTIARLFVSEVRQRASDKHAEDASLAILQFLSAKLIQKPATQTSNQQAQSGANDKTTDETKQVNSASSMSKSAELEHVGEGWNLLLSLNILANSQNTQIIQLLCDASLPSTLIKCLYLFFDLPATTKMTTTMTSDESESGISNNNNTGNKQSPIITCTRVLASGPLIRAFTQLLVQLCSYQSAIDELIRKDDLRLLIGIASSQCLAHNRPWRKTAFQALLAISRNMRDNFMYLEQNICIQVYVENMHRINSLGLASTENFVDMIMVLLEFLYNLDVNNRNQPRCIAPLIEQFKSSRIIEFIEELLFRIDETIVQELNQTSSSPTTERNEADPFACPVSEQPSVSSEIGVCVDDYRRYGKRLVHSLTLMAKLNFSPDAIAKNTSLKPLTMSRFEMFEQFRMPRPSARDCVLNLDALRLLKMGWSKCRDSHIIESILDATISLFNDDKYNYFIFESQQLLVYYMTSSNFNQFPHRVKQKLFKFLEFIIIETHYIPCLELGTLGSIIKSKTSSDMNRILVLRTLIATLRFNSKFSDIFREIGLLEVLIDLLVETMQDDKLISYCSDKSEVLYLLLEASQYLLAGPNNLNCTQFNESGAARHVFNCLSKPKFFHLFIPPHSSSSDDGGAASNASRTSTPTPTAPGRQRQHLNPVIHTQNQWMEAGCFGRAQNKPSIKQMQKVAFTIIRQLILSTAGDEHLANLLGLLARNLDDLKSLESCASDNKLAIKDELDPDQCPTKSPTSPRLDFTFLLSQEVNLKIYILKSLIIILKDNHRCRMLFKKVGGFIYIVSSLETLEKALPLYGSPTETDIEFHDRWRKINSRRIWRLIKNSFMTVVVAMRSEPASLRVFSEDVMTKFTEAIRNLGCFNSACCSLPQASNFDVVRSGTDNNYNSYKSIFLSPPARDFSTVANETMKPNEACCQLFRFLYDMSLDMADGTVELEKQLDEESGQIFKTHHATSYDTKSISFDQGASMYDGSGIYKRRSQLQKSSIRPPSLDLNSCSPDPATLTFPCIISSIIDLVPSCPNQDLMVFVCLIIKSLFKQERNQQMLCEAGIISKLLDSNWRISITDRSHFLHNIVESMFEKLTKQSITTKELRMFFRLNDPLCCQNLDDIEVKEEPVDTNFGVDGTEIDSTDNTKALSVLNIRPKEKIATYRIETFVAMMGDKKSKPQPPFIEFDMSSDGCSSIFMPSISPVNVKSLPPNSSPFLNSTLDVHTNEKNGILGGVGSAERHFPPQSGFTFSTWFYIERFPSRSPDASHNLKLLTIYRGSAATGKEYSCFRVQISALDRALTISTQEALLFDNENRSDVPHDPDCFLRIWTPELLVEGKWHHVAITINKCSSKQSTIVVYVDGVPVHNQRICYISNHLGTPNSGPLGNAGPGSGACSPAAFVNAFIGSPPQFRIQLRTRWKQGPCHMIEEPLGPNFIAVIYSLGPNFIGNFQSSNKLNELAKLKQSRFESSKYNQSDAQGGSHKPLSHQQSASVVQSPSRHGAPLTRVSSSAIASTNMTTSSHHQTSSSKNHYHIAEDRILMSIDARATSLMTLSRMRRIYTRFDCRQVSRVLGLALQENSTPILLLHNTGLHLNGPSRGIGAITIGHNHIRCFVPSPTEQTLFHVGGSYVLLGLIAQSETIEAFNTSTKALVWALTHNVKLQAQMENINGYQILTVFFWKKKHLMSPEILKLIFTMITDSSNIYTIGKDPKPQPIRQVNALRDLICECFDLWLQTGMINLVLEFIHDLISSNHDHQSATETSNSVRARNLKNLRDMDLLPRMLRLLPQPQQDSASVSDSNETSNTQQYGEQIFDTKAIYLIKQTVFELLNRTPRQSDILYFGQFLAALLPSSNEERPEKTVNLRNVLLKSLLQMITKNKQKEVNSAMQEELVRILGFDWFMLFISGSHIDDETITLGFLNLMIILSNDELYASFKGKTPTNGGWLKEPTFPTMDGKFNIQLLGINVGAFFGMNGKRKSMRQEILEVPNLFLLTTCLTNLIRMPRIYLMIFQTIMNRLCKIDATVIDTISAFDKLNLDILCDSLIGDTHHKRRQTLASIKFRSLELTVCIVYMMRDIMLQYKEPEDSKEVAKDQSNELTGTGSYMQFPTDIVRFFMYLYNNNQEFQNYCRRSEDLIDALCETLMQPEDISSASTDSNSMYKASSRQMTQHPATKEILELSRLIILDRMTEVSNPGETSTVDQLLPFERFLDSFAACKEAQGELVHMTLRQILLMIDSTARHNSIKTIGSSENIQHFELLLVNSISISQIVTDKIWSHELFQDNLGRISTIIDHQLCLAEQIFKFNEMLPKHNPPYAFIMQRILNRVLLFALSRPTQHMSDKILMLDLLKKIYDNRTIIILNHMHSPQSAEFFVCFTYCLMKIIEDNMMSPSKKLPPTVDQQASLIERQYGHPLNRSITDASSSSCLMLVSLARKVWDAIYQSKKGTLSEAFDISLSLPAFTLDTSLDLMQLKPDIYDSCEKYWSGLVEAEQRPRKRLQTRQTEPTSGTTSVAANLLSGRLTRVVNAASFVSRVVGATAGTMASNVNLVGEKLGQTRANKRDLVGRLSTDTGASDQGQQQISGPLAPTSNQSVSMQSDQVEMFKYTGLSKVQICEANQSHISIIEDYIKLQLSQKNHKLALHKYLCDEWHDIEFEMLLRERALFGPDYGSKLDKWCLDMTEGPRRMRKKMVNNSKQFYENYAYKPEQYNPSNKSLRYRPPMSYDSHLYYLKTLNMDRCLLDSGEKQQREENITSAAKGETKSDVEEAVANSLASANGDEGRQTAPTINVDSHSSTKSIRELHSSIESLTLPQDRSGISPGSPRPTDYDADDCDSTSFVDFSPEIEAETNSAKEAENSDSLSVLRLLEKNERISHMFRCSRVQGLDTYEGLLLFGREHFYLIDGFTLLKTREIKDIDSLPPDAHDPIIPNSTPNILAHSKKTCSKFSFDSVVEVHKRRYLLQPIALEVFSSDGRNTLIVFPRNIRNKVYSRLMTVATQITSNANESLAGQKSNVSVEGGSGLLSNLIGETSVTQRWVRGELSNFQYLMNLNTIAGRSYNDLMQYPIFPWILADYSSDFLDLSKPSTFRDLSRPVGAQTSDRLEQFKRRFAEWDDTETPPYHYGTFYSSAMIVASYMVRMEPFTQHFLRLQGGHFDLADRMFHSINDSWMSASKHNMADIKELIPEFFYLPEFLINENKYDLGIKQSGKKLDNVILPPWAKNDAREFIRLHRCALESDYVSAHLHEWIDLIFGYKQQGQPAIDAVNVFHHLFYEGNVDIYNTDIDPIKKNAVIGFINNFGQVPKQLFKKPHPQRKVTGNNYSGVSTSIPLTPILPSLSTVSSANSNQRVLTHYPQLLKLTNTTFKDLRGPVGQIVQVDKNIVAVEQNKLLIPPDYCRYVAWGHADRSLRLGLYDSERPIFVWEGSDNLMPTEILCCTIPNSRTLVTAGTESLITVWKIEKMRSFAPVTNLYGHTGPVTCLASSQPYSIIVSGSRDKTAIIWDLNRLTFVRQLGGGKSDNLVHHGPISAIAINDSTGDIATCASSWLHLWTINGELLAQLDTFSVTIQQQSFGIGTSMSSNLSQLHILCVCFSQFKEWDSDEVIITGTSDGSIALWSLRYYQSPMTKAEIDEANKHNSNNDAVKPQESSGNREVPEVDEIKPSSAEVVAPSPTAQQQETTTQGDADLDKISLSSPNTTNSKTVPQSEPIAIKKGRQRTETMNSEWVKLSSTSSASTADTIPMLRATPTSPLDPIGDMMSSDSFLASGDLSFTGDSCNFLAEAPSDKRLVTQSDGPECSTPILSTGELDERPNTRDGSVCTTVARASDRSSLNNLSMNEDEVDGQSISKANLLLMPNDPSLIKFSKSDTSLVDSFVILGDTSGGGGAASSSNVGQYRQGSSSGGQRGSSERVRPQSSAAAHSPRQQHAMGSASSQKMRKKFIGHQQGGERTRNGLKLAPNNCWRRELYLRMLLPRRQSKMAPTAATSLTISKDHKTLYVGDASGRITSWTTS